MVDVVEFRYYIDPETGEPHLYNLGISEAEVEEVFSSKMRDDRQGRRNSRILTGQTDAGRFVKVIYSPDPEPASVFVITAYEIRGKTLAGFKRRQRRRK
jgi:hypothetical protein